ncbi:zinc finger MYM-type protein 1-like [Dorcoceras hygrometricum]|uniref:Zinc finger MYM-type protein 1-like n=1 Tax=Dorcoceras hygrometricum TaxID=472368 RepID=A0A2Z7ASA1_9LAMI|nr:zinc finger MYM-type protein 1-like [Dorcoceras hygrometricum]
MAAKFVAAARGIVALDGQNLRKCCALLAGRFARDGGRWTRDVARGCASRLARRCAAAAARYVAAAAVVRAPSGDVSGSFATADFF